MAELTLTIDDEVLQRARARAREQSTSVDAIVREYLETYAQGERKRGALRQLVELSRRSTASSGVEGRSWTRDDVYDR